MPGFDRTGPEGQGPRTGRQMGKCRPAPGSDDPDNVNQKDDNQEYDNRFFGRGLGRGPGFGRGRGLGRGLGFRGGRGGGRRFRGGSGY